MTYKKRKRSRAPPTMQTGPPWPASGASPAEQHALWSRMLLMMPQTRVSAFCRLATPRGRGCGGDGQA